MVGECVCTVGGACAQWRACVYRVVHVCPAKVCLVGGCVCTECVCTVGSCVYTGVHVYGR